MIRPQQWSPSDGLTLEPNALIAAQETQRNLALTAGPGAGKTEMLAQRADFLLRTGACRYPRRILAISFKVDAAHNLKDRVRRRCGNSLAARLDSQTFHAFAKRLIDRFRPVLTGRDALDTDYAIGKTRIQGRQIRFQDMVPLALSILQNSDVARNAVRQTYSHVFLDEFQDCTDSQYQLIRTAFLGTGVSLTAVGDTKQRIMGWAGAMEGIFQTFADDFSARRLNLYQNFRSQPRLRLMQNAMVKVMDPPAAAPDTEFAGHGGLVEILPFEDSQQEAEALADMIRGWIDTEGVAASEIAILVARQPDLYASLVMTELQERAVPFSNEQLLQDLSVEPAARLIVDFLAVIVGEREPDAYGRLMDILMDEELSDDAAYELRARWRRFIEKERIGLHESSRGRVDVAALHDMAKRFLSVLGRDRVTALSPDYEQGNRLDEIISQTFDRITELFDSSSPTQALAKFYEDSSVRIMTIHKSKGLEFDTVVILGIENETFLGNIDEKRSVFFVAISRAKRRICLTHVNFRERPEGFSKRWRKNLTPHQEFLGYAVSVIHP